MYGHPVGLHLTKFQCCDEESRHTNLDDLNDREEFRDWCQHLATVNNNSKAFFLVVFHVVLSDFRHSFANKKPTNVVRLYFGVFRRRLLPSNG